MDLKKKFSFLLIVLVFIGSGITAEYGKIDQCFSTPLCVTDNSSNQPTLIENASEETKETFNFIEESTTAEWNINATAERRYVNVTVLAEVSGNPFVKDTRDYDHRKEIQIKGLIPENDTVGHPFFMASRYKNPQILPANSKEFSGNEKFSFDSYVNVSDSPENSSWTAFMFANSTNPFVDQQRSRTGTIKIGSDTTENVTDPTDPGDGDDGDDNTTDPDPVADAFSETEKEIVALFIAGICFFLLLKQD